MRDREKVGSRREEVGSTEIRLKGEESHSKKHYICVIRSGIGRGGEGVI